MKNNFLHKVGKALALLLLLNAPLYSAEVLISFDELMATLCSFGINLEGEWQTNITPHINEETYPFAEELLKKEFINHLTTLIAQAHKKHQIKIQEVKFINPALNIDGMELDNQLKFIVPRQLSQEERATRQHNDNITLHDQNLTFNKYDTITYNNNGMVDGKLVLEAIYRLVINFIENDLFTRRDESRVPLARGKIIPQFNVIYECRQNNIYLECRGYEDAQEGRQAYQALNWYKTNPLPHVHKIQLGQPTYQSNSPQSWKRWMFNTGRWLLLFSAIGYLAYETLSDNEQQEHLQQQVDLLYNELATLRQRVTNGASDYCITHEASSITEQLHVLQTELAKNATSLPANIIDQFNMLQEFMQTSDNKSNSLAENVNALISQLSQLSSSTEAIRQALVSFASDILQQTNTSLPPSCDEDMETDETPLGSFSLEADSTSGEISSTTLQNLLKALDNK